MTETSSGSRFLLLFLSLFLVLGTVWALPDALYAPSAVRRAPAADEEPRGPWEGVSPDVQYDNYTLILKGQRVFLHSGEFHTFRLPVPSLWPDIMQKTKAAGLNSLSVYIHMGLSNPAPGVVDWDSYRALKPLYEAAQESGIWIVLRPGPYINAETTAGGIAHWATSEVAGRLRSNDTDWRAAWKDYIQGIIDETAPYQISKGGPVIAIQIDNEYTQQGAHRAGYYQDLIDFYRNSSKIDVLLTYNDFSSGRSFVNGTGAVDLVGLDEYPQGFDCSNPLVWQPLPNRWYHYHLEVNPWQPWYIPEFQGGAFDAWGPTAPGYDACRILTGANFQSVFNLGLWASNAKLINYYMFYGGTSWGGVPHPGVYTSYDYGAAIRENRDLSAKFDEVKRQGLFLRSSPEFYKTKWLGDSSAGLNVSNNPNVHITKLRNADGPATFYIARHRDSTSNETASYRLTVDTDVGELELPLFNDDLTLAGRQSRVIITDYTFGKGSKVLQTNAQIFFAGTIDDRDVLIVYGDVGQAHEISIYASASGEARVQESDLIKINEDTTEGGQVTTTVTLLPGIEGLVTIFDTQDKLVMFLDTEMAGTFWAPAIAGAAEDPFRHFWGIGTNQSIIVGGPYLVRDAVIEGDSLALTGDLKTDVRLTIVVPKNIQSLTWNGIQISPDVQASSALSEFGGVIVADLKLRGGEEALASGVEVPELEGWKYKDSLPEIGADYDDAEWTVADHNTTNIPYPRYYGDGRVLYGCDYGFCENVVLWRGHFQATGQEKSVNLTINGGTAFAASVWLNDAFLGTSFGNSTNNRNIIEERDKKFVFPEGALVPDADNVITVVQDNTGLAQTNYGNYDGNTSKSPRGIRGFQLDTGTFGDWKVQGKVGGYRNFPDKTRGILNEGGLYGERLGWHLPGYALDDTWVERDLAEGLPDQVAGVGWFLTTFNLDVPEGLDAMFSFEFEEGLGQPYRALLFVNGWMMGKRVANLGPQAKFPVHEGILDYRGENTIAVALWSLTPNVTVSPTLKLKLDTVLDGGVGNVVVNNPKWSAEGRPEA
ncbi:glycoside hydrolase family 35 protein [Coprinopsis sp. MPI-PUGE-AT-0042]|nr:glycoside hydrolase family 35 protein [Coprinopsis sp. MPI-PUGE-AT-0042]